MSGDGWHVVTRRCLQSRAWCHALEVEHLGQQRLTRIQPNPGTRQTLAIWWDLSISRVIQGEYSGRIELGHLYPIWAEDNDFTIFTDRDSFRNGILWSVQIIPSTNRHKKWDIGAKSFQSSLSMSLDHKFKAKSELPKTAWSSDSEEIFNKVWFLKRLPTSNYNISFIS